MAVRGVSNAVCPHSHLWHPLCPQQSLSTRVTNVFLLALAVVIASVIYYAISMSDSPPNSGEAKATSPTRSPETARPVPTAGPLATLRIQSADEIGNIPKIIGVPIDVIQQRARPIAYGRDGITIVNRGETIRGFIQNKDSFLDVVRENWQQAKQQAGITHAELADHLHHLIEQAKAAPKTVIPYDPRTKKSDTQAERMPRFIVSLREKEDDHDTDIFRPEDAGKEVGASNEEAVIINTAVQGKYIRWTPVRERYIREFGFYSIGMDFDIVLDVLMSRPK